jgi:hypothetical protein
MALAILSLFLIAGCGRETDAGPNPTGKFGLEKSEFIAAKKAGKGLGDLKKEETQRKIQRMKERGIAVEITSGKKKSRPR